MTREFFLTTKRIGFSEWKSEDGKYEIGFHLRPKYWRQGYAKEGAEAVVPDFVDFINYCFYNQISSNHC